MTLAFSEVVVPFYGKDGKATWEMRIAAPYSGGAPVPIAVLDSVEARHWHEQPIQLLEGVSYDYEIQYSVPGVRLREGVVRRSPLSTPLVERGRIEPGLHTGALTLTLESASGEKVGEALVEVRSRKLNYREQYRLMLENLADRALDLLTDISSPASTWLRPDERKPVDNLVQRFFFVRRLVLSADFRAAVARIASNPNEVTTEFLEERSTSRALRGSGRLLLQFASGQPRSPVPLDHPMGMRFPSVPRRVTSPRSQPSRDTRENRFVKFVLRSLDEFVAEVDRALLVSGASEYRYVRSQCSELREELSEQLALGLFRDVGDQLPILPLGSAALQRRAGYRELLRAWMQFQLASQLSWDGGDDVFLAGKRDIASLYEYWVFFQLLDIVSRKFRINKQTITKLISRTERGLNFHLKSGRKLTLRGVWVNGPHSFCVRFSYNRTFSRKPNPTGDEEKSFPNGGSWTRSMRPDYTLSIWPDSLTEESAELAGHVAHLHFDAKYRVEQISDLFGDEGEVGEEATPSRATARRSDLLKMHAYRDAIRRSASAFVIYPGSENRRWRAYNEILPGLGAIALSPGEEEGAEVLSDFIDQAISLVATAINT